MCSVTVELLEVVKDQPPDNQEKWKLKDALWNAEPTRIRYIDVSEPTGYMHLLVDAWEKNQKQKTVRHDFKM